MPIFSAIITGLWLLFFVYWLVAAVGVKRNVSRDWNGVAIRVGIAIVVLIGFRTGIAQHVTMFNHAGPTSPAAGVVAIVITLIGIGWAIWARRHLGRNWGMPMSLKAEPELVSTGPYAHVRHPIYTGILVAMLGSSLVLGVWLPLAVLFGAYFIYSAKTEEKRLVEQMPQQYPPYMRRTKMLIPFVF